MFELVNKFLAGAILSVTGALIISKLLERKINFLSIKTIIILLLLSSTTIILYRIHIDLAITLTIFILATYAYARIFEISIDKSVIATFLVILLLCIAEIILTIIIVLIFRADIETLRDVNTLTPIFVHLTVCTLAVNILVIKKVQQRFKDLLLLISGQRIPIIILFCLIELIVIGLILSRVDLNFKITYNLLINIILIAFFVVIFFVFIAEKLRYQELTSEFDYLLNYVKNIEDWMEKDRIRNHENKNQLVVIKNMVPKNNRKLNEYINSILNESVVIENDWVSKLKNLPKGGLQGLIYYKISQIEKAKINLFLDIDRDLRKDFFSKINVADYRDLCTIIGVYLDNAIEAAGLCKKPKDRQLGIEMYADKGEIKIIIYNTFCGKLNIERFDLNGYSTKGNKRGYGLPLVRSIIEKSKRFTQQREIINNYYVQHLNIKIHTS